MRSLWPDLLEQKEQEKNNSISIIREQVRELQRITQGAVSAVFRRIQYQPGPADALLEFGKYTSQFSSSAFKEKIEDELAGKEDINDLFRVKKYKFELCNKNYRFRVFVLNYSTLFPISLEVDEGISEEIKYRNGEKIESNDALICVLEEIFSSKKVKRVLQNMLVESEDN